MEHRGASGADNATGDGAGAMVTIAHEMFEEELRFVKKLHFLHSKVIIVIKQVVLLLFKIIVLM